MDFAVCDFWDSHQPTNVFFFHTEWYATNLIASLFQPIIITYPTWETIYSWANHIKPFKSRYMCSLYVRLSLCIFPLRCVMREWKTGTPIQSNSTVLLSTVIKAVSSPCVGVRLNIRHSGQQKWRWPKHAYADLQDALACTLLRYQQAGKKNNPIKNNKVECFGVMTIMFVIFFFF